MIKVKKIEFQIVETFDPEGNSLGYLNEYELYDLRAQIAEQNAEGYYFIFGGKEIKIDLNGECEEWPSELFEGRMDSLMRILRANREKTENE